MELYGMDWRGGSIHGKSPYIDSYVSEKDRDGCCVVAPNTLSYHSSPAMPAEVSLAWSVVLMVPLKLFRLIVDRYLWFLSISTLSEVDLTCVEVFRSH